MLMWARQGFDDGFYDVVERDLINYKQFRHTLYDNHGDIVRDRDCVSVDTVPEWAKRQFIEDAQRRGEE